MDSKIIAAVVLVVALLAAFAGGYKVADWRATAKANADALARAEKAEAGRTKAIEERDAMAQRLAASDLNHTEALRKAQDENDSLRNRIAAGTVGLRIRAVCPVRAPATAEAAAGPRVDTGTPAELDDAAGRAYSALRQGISQTAAQLAACQDELRMRTVDK